MPALREFLKPTNNWHLQRASKLQGLSQEEHLEDISSHLSIELCPLHFSKVDKSIDTYIEKNRDEIIKYTLGFSALASRKIENGPWHNKVAVRLSPSKFQKHIKKLGFKASSENQPDGISNKDITKESVCAFELNLWEDVTFLAMRGVRNQLKESEVKKAIGYSLKKPNGIKTIKFEYKNNK